ncbi:hypothetical protein M011DRAFT_242435 [Sporormia fimetaria CBS 119925]|uniref:Uncharacterized protein n=1 Tax=Sporormia fimetaria CBS 119925 TaxID=1340428 RepID=A0A6A6VIG8_9PLEO|nr:hypothetical protein M011DRAFT_242435 [Sporormia fimetaria CBS 119925]
MRLGRDGWPPPMAGETGTRTTTVAFRSICKEAGRHRTRTAALLFLQRQQRILVDGGRSCVSDLRVLHRHKGEGEAARRRVYGIPQARCRLAQGSAAVQRAKVEVEDAVGQAPARGRRGVNWRRRTRIRRGEGDGRLERRGGCDGCGGSGGCGERRRMVDRCGAGDVAKGPGVPRVNAAAGAGGLGSCIEVASGAETRRAAERTAEAAGREEEISSSSSQGGATVEHKVVAGPLQT